MRGTLAQGAHWHEGYIGTRGTAHWQTGLKEINSDLSFVLKCASYHIIPLITFNNFIEMCIIPYHTFNNMPVLRLLYSIGALGMCVCVGREVGRKGREGEKG